MIKGITYTILRTGDMTRARAFYTEQLGLTTEDDTGGFSQFTTRDGSLWALLAADETASSGAIEPYLQVDNADHAYQTWQTRGVDLLTAPHDEPFGRTFSLRDPDGRVLHVYEPAGGK